MISTNPIVNTAGFYTKYINRTINHTSTAFTIGFVITMRNYASFYRTTHNCTELFINLRR